MREWLPNRELEFVPVFRYGEPPYSSSVSDSDVMIYIDATGGDEQCVQVPLPQTLMPPIERQILIAESLGLSQLSDLQREELRREIAALTWDHSRLYETLEKSGRLVGFYADRSIADEWGLKEISFDSRRKKVTLSVDVDDAARLDAIRKQLASSGYREADAIQRSRLKSERKRLSDLIAYPPIDWRVFYRRVRSRLDKAGSDFRLAASIQGLMRKWSKESTSRSLVRRLEVSCARNGIDKVELHGNAIRPRDLIALVAQGDEVATDAAADLLILGYSNLRNDSFFERRISTNKFTPNEEPDNGLPEWARQEKPYLLSWAERCGSAEPISLSADVARYISREVGKGRLNLLMFDPGLYEEVATADFVAGTSSDLVSYPFPLAIVLMHGREGIYGAAVFEWTGFRRHARTEEGKVCPTDGYGAMLVCEEGCLLFEQDPASAGIAARLITYLDCDNAMLDSVYVDGGSSTRTYRPSVAPQPTRLPSCRVPTLSSGPVLLSSVTDARRAAMASAGRISAGSGSGVVATGTTRSAG